jgi:hypothetical protein
MRDVRLNNGIYHLAYQLVFLTRHSISKPDNDRFLQSSNMDDLDNAVGYFLANAPFGSIADQKGLYDVYIVPLGDTVQIPLIRYEQLARTMWCREYCLQNLINAQTQAGYYEKVRKETYEASLGFSDCTSTKLESVERAMLEFQSKYGFPMLENYNFIMLTVPDEVVRTVQT